MNKDKSKQVPFFENYFKSFNLSLFLIKTGLNLLTVILIVEFLKYPDLNIDKIIMYVLFVISSKLSWLIVLNQNTNRK